LMLMGNAREHCLSSRAKCATACLATCPAKPSTQDSVNLCVSVPLWFKAAGLRQISVD